MVVEKGGCTDSRVGLLPSAVGGVAALRRNCGGLVWSGLVVWQRGE